MNTIQEKQIQSEYLNTCSDNAMNSCNRTNNLEQPFSMFRMKLKQEKKNVQREKKFKIELVPTFYTLQATATGSIYNLQSKYRKEEKRLEISVT